MSMFNDIEWTKKGKEETCTQIQKKSRRTRRNSRRDTGHSSALGTTRSGVEIAFLNLKENATPSAPRWCNDPKKLVTQFLRVPVLLSRGILRRVKGKDSIHINADASNTELCFRIIHSSKSAQLSFYGAVSSWCEEFCPRPNERADFGKVRGKENVQLLKNVKPQEVNSLVQIPRSDDSASGNRLREWLQNFETLEN